MQFERKMNVNQKKLTSSYQLEQINNETPQLPQSFRLNEMSSKHETSNSIHMFITIYFNNYVFKIWKVFWSSTPSFFLELCM